MSDKPLPDSTLTKLMRSSAEDEVLHRALRLPARYPKQIALADANGREIETKYMFVSSDPIGEGGTALVFQVRDTQLNAVRALKVLLVDLRSSPAAEERWRRERELLLAMEKVDAPCVPTIYDVGHADGLPVIVMQFVDGVTLSHKLAELSRNSGGLRKDSNYLDKYVRFVVAVMRPLASSLAHIENHFMGTANQGFAHGDLKPSNIVIDERDTGSVTDARLEIEHVWLLDFGEASVRNANEARGITPDYSSPEQLADWASHRSPQVTPATDQYQLGIVLQELLRPVESQGGLWHWRPRHLCAGWRIRHLAQIATRLTARRPPERFTNFKSVSRALERTESLPRRRVGGFAAIIGFVALLAALFAIPLHGSGDRNESRPADMQLAVTAIENEWKRWQQPELATSSREQLEKQLPVQFEQWRSAFGKATADKIVTDLRRRLTHISGGQYELRILSAVPDKYFKRSVAPTDIVIVKLEVENLGFASLHGRISREQRVIFDPDKITFTWQPGIGLGLYIYIRAPKDPQSKDIPAPLGPLELPPQPIDWGLGNNSAGRGIMAIPVNTKCTQFKDDSFSGQFNEKNIDWRLEIRRVQ